MSAAHARQYYVYILTNGTRTLYVGMTNDLEKKNVRTQGQTRGWLY